MAKDELSLVVVKTGYDSNNYLILCIAFNRSGVNDNNIDIPYVSKFGKQLGKI